jgi:hypothetical protein
VMRPIGSAAKVRKGCLGRHVAVSGRVSTRGGDAVSRASVEMDRANLGVSNAKRATTDGQADKERPLRAMPHFQFS